MVNTLPEENSREKEFAPVEAVFNDIKVKFLKYPSITLSDAAGMFNDELAKISTPEKKEEEESERQVNQVVQDQGSVSAKLLGENNE